MEIIVAKHSGFCKGVDNAVNVALNIENKNTYVYGEIIHNESVIKAIEDRGIKTIENLSDAPEGCTLIIRSHGAGKTVYKYCKNHNIKIVDCTCTFVKRTQAIVYDYFKKGYNIIIIGEPTHPEVIGLNGWCENSAKIISPNQDEVDLEQILGEKNCIVAQTTISNSKFSKIVKFFDKVEGKIVEIFKTICYTTIERQNEAETLSKQCDAMIVIGGFNSSNTDKLYKICLEHCDNVFRINSADGLNYKKILKYKKVGIVSGASTPNSQTQEVLLKMETEVKAIDMNDVIAEMDGSKINLKKGQIINVSVSLANDDGLAVLLPQSKKEILLDKAELIAEDYKKEDYPVGQDIEVMVVAKNPVKLSQKAIQAVKEEEAAIAEIEQGKEFTAEIKSSNKGGLVAYLGSYQVFIPAKEIRMGYVKELEKYVGKKLRVKSLEIKKDGKRKEIIASARVIIEAEKTARDLAKAEKENAFFDSIKVDDIVDGKVERITTFGAFVSVNGFDCLAHISDLAWDGAKDVASVLTIGETYKFKVLKIDRENKKVSIGYKQLQPQAWDLIDGKYHEGDIICGKVVRIVPFGAFVEVEKGIDGLVHVSQISNQWLENPTSALTIGQEVEAKIMAIEIDKKKMTLSIKALLPEVERKPRPKRNDDEEKPSKTRKPRTPKSDDEVREWSEDDVGGASIAEMLNKD